MKTKGITLSLLIAAISPCCGESAYRPRDGDFDVSGPSVHAQIMERWGRMPARDQIVISPAAIFESEVLVTVHSQ